MNNPSSDEKLLKIIEAKDKLKPAPNIGFKPKPKAAKPVSFKLILGFAKSKISLPNLNKGLFVAAVLLSVYFLFVMASGIKMNGLDSAKASPAMQKLITQPVSNFLKRQDYLKEVNKRNIFLLPEQKPSGPAQAQAPTIPELMRDLKLVGIIWSNNPEAMIENTKENRTYLLKKEDTFSSPPYKVKNVLRSSVILEIPSEEGPKEYELR